MNPGELRHQVRIEARSTVQDSAGEPLLEWTPFTTRRASIERTPGREAWNSAQREARVPTLFRLRYLAGVLPAMRLIFNSKVYDIISAIDPDGQKSDLLITAEEHVEEVQ